MPPVAVSMKRSATIFFQIVVVLIGIGILFSLLVEPWVEGVNANVTMLSEIYFDDPFLAYIYVSFIAVFIGLYQAFKLFGYVRQNNVCSPEGAKALRTITYCAISFAGLISVAVIYIVATTYGKDDISGGVAMGLFFIVTSLVIVAVTAMFEKKALKPVA